MISKDKISELAENRFTVIDDFISALELKNINEDIDKIRPQFKSGGTGQDKIVKSDIRQDMIYWVPSEKPLPSEKFLLSKMEDLILTLNENLFLGIWSQEFHFSIYPEKAFYKTHVDRFKNTSSRVVSVILYLNKDWSPEKGGELVLHLNEQKRIEPIGGRLVCFMSEDLPHEVLPCTEERRSFTGWLKKRDLQLS